MNCKYAKIKHQTDTGKLESICVCEHPNYEIEKEKLADRLSEYGKTLIANRECQFVRELVYTMCPLVNNT